MAFWPEAVAWIFSTGTTAPWGGWSRGVLVQKGERGEVGEGSC